MRSSSKLVASLTLAAMLTACGNSDESSSVNNAIEATKEAASKAVEATTEAANDVVDGAKEVANDAADMAGDAVDGAQEMASDAVEGAKDPQKGKEDEIGERAIKIKT